MHETASKAQTEEICDPEVIKKYTGTNPEENWKHGAHAEYGAHVGCLMNTTGTSSQEDCEYSAHAKDNARMGKHMGTNPENWERARKRFKPRRTTGLITCCQPKREDGEHA